MRFASSASQPAATKIFATKPSSSPAGTVTMPFFSTGRSLFASEIASRLRKRTIDKRLGAAQVACRVHQFGNGLPIKLSLHRRILCKRFGQRNPLGKSAIASKLDPMMGLFTAEMRRQPHHHRFRKNQSARYLQILPHAL